MPTLLAPTASPVACLGDFSRRVAIKSRPGWRASKPTVLLVDDDPRRRQGTGRAAGQEGYPRPRGSLCGAEALAFLESRPADVVLHRFLRMPGMDGMELLDVWLGGLAGDPGGPAHRARDGALAVEAMKRGASDFMQKPFEREEVLFVVKKALAGGKRGGEEAPAAAPGTSGLSAAPRRCRGGWPDREGRAGYGDGARPRRERHRKRARRRGDPRAKPAQATSRSSSSTARAPREPARERALRSREGRVHRRGAAQAGPFELADKGTLFLDEIGELPLRAGEAAARPAGARVRARRRHRRPSVDVRVVAATHRDLEAMVASGEFREDLYYRLRVVTLRIPPLRERREDIAAARAALRRRVRVRTQAPSRARPGRRSSSCAASPGPATCASSELDRAPGGAVRWPPDWRQDIERELAREPPALRASRAAWWRPPPMGPPPRRARSKPGTQRREAEKEAIRTALRKAANNRTVAARILGVSRRTLYNKLEEYGSRSGEMTRRRRSR